MTCFFTLYIEQCSILCYVQYMTQTRFEKKKAKTKDHLAKVGTKLLLKKGLNKVSMDEIAKTADVARGTLYNHFKTKSELLHHYILIHRKDEEVVKVQTCFKEKNTAARMKKFLKFAGDFAEQNKPIVQLYGLAKLNDYFNENVLKLPSSTVQVLTQIFAIGQAEGEIKKDFTPEELANLFNSLYLNVMLPWLRGEDVHDMDEQAFKLVDFFLEGAKI